MIVQLFLPLIFFFRGLLATSGAGFFDLAEYRRISYDASIGQDFLWFAKDLDIREVSTENIDEYERKIVEKLPEESTGNYLFVTSKGGQKFACSLPDVEGLKKPDAPKSSKNPRIYGELLAASFYVDKCIKMRGNHWWSYVLCRGQTVEQVHGELSAEKDGFVKNILGIFDGTLSMPPYAESTDDRLLYVEESYSSGTFCDLAEYKEARRTKVRYECDSSLSTNEAYIQSVVEIKPCTYLMTVKVATLCSFPEFLPASQANTQAIGCQPFITKTDVRGFLERQLLERQEKIDQEIEERLAKQRQRLASDRFTAMTKSTRKFNDADKIKLTEAEMDYRAAHFDLMVLTYSKNREEVTPEKLDALWKLLTTVDLGTYTFYVDYDTIADENRGHLWYYFNDPSWPKDQFPKDIYLTAVQNEYIKEVQSHLASKLEYDDKDGSFLTSMDKFWRTGQVELDDNLVITSDEIYEDILKNLVSNENPDWLNKIYKVCLREMGDIYHGVMDLAEIPYKKRKDNQVPSLEVHFFNAIPDMLVDIQQNMKVISETGKPDRDDVLFDVIEVEEVTKESRVKNGAKFEMFLFDEKSLYREAQDIFAVKLAPIFTLLSIMYFQESNLNYFHVWPPRYEHLESDYTEDGKAHLYLTAQADAVVKLMASYAAYKIKQETILQYVQKRPVFNMERFIKEGANFIKASEERLVDDDPKYREEEERHELVSRMIEIFYHQGKKIVSAARQRIWKKRVEKYRMNYWVQDYKLRKEAKSLHELMTSMLATSDKNSQIHTIGDVTKKKKEKKVVVKMDEIEKGMKKYFSDLDSIKGTDETGFENDFEEMEDIMDLLGKAGLNKDVSVDVQIKLYDANGNEVMNDELDAIAKELMDGVESVSRFKKTEKAYDAKPYWPSEEEEEEALKRKKNKENDMQ